MLARRLLIAGGGGSFVAPYAGQGDTDVLNVRVGTDTNQAVTDGTAIVWDVDLNDHDGVTVPSGAWSAGSPDRLTVPRNMKDCTIEVHLTTLGTNYSGATNIDVVISVTKNWSGSGEYLSTTIAGVRNHHSDGVNAQLDELSQYVGDLTSGDVLQVITFGGGGSLLVEANPTSSPPSVPGNFNGLAGTGIIGTHFVLRGT